MAAIDPASIPHYYMNQAIQGFWQWFETNNQAYFSLNEADAETRERHLNALLKHLHRYSDHLWFELSGLPNAEQELIITVKEI